MMMNVKEAAVFLRISERNVRKMINRREGDPLKLPCYRIGTRIVFDPEEIQAYLHAQCKG